MNEQRVDRRIRRTKKLLLNSLTHLMTEKKISKITVKDLTDLADVNRGTFYLYYKDIFDMLDQLQTDLYNNLSDAFEKFSKDTTTYDNMLSYFTFIFEFIQDNCKLFRILIGSGSNYDSSFIDKFKKNVKGFQPTLESSVPQSKLHYFRPFVISGCIGVVQQWLEDDMSVSPKEMAVFVTDIITTRVNYLK